MLRIGLFLLTNMAVMLVFGIILSITGIDRQSMMGLVIMAGLFGFTGSIISLLMSKTIALKSVGGKVIQQPKDQTEAWLLETVQKQASLAGIGMPSVAIYQAADMNAFATGANRNDALVAVSTGLLTQMQKNEVEAVLAHEVSHIANGDMITMTLLQGVVNTFVIFISRFIAQAVASLGSNNDNGRTPSMGTYFIVVMVLEVVFVLV
ncbi:heat shock protein HtpX [Thorsellia anophelis DSM 18579]|uniref:Heat shock protein HtpX n=1 Tax=Thorsellia anophelis DSM 18579 TaxID=1123402 RepID=A0A1I0D2C3_9GAMM|nr:heat shock protein HtpX [Thorsellia anophelis DSM 18579]